MVPRRPNLLSVVLALAGLWAAQAACPAAIAADPTQSELWCRHTILIYSYPSSAKEAGLTVEDLKRLAAYCSPDGKPLDFFFDGFLILGFGCKGGRNLLSTVGKPALKGDWDDAAAGYLDAAVRLSDAFAQVRQALNDPNRKAKIIIAIPSPDVRNTAFGPIVGKTLDLSRQECRLEALKWYVDEVLRGWDDLAAQGRLGAAQLVGFYWGQEGLLSYRTRDGVVKDADLVKDVASYVHSKGRLLHWIPGFRGGRVFEKTPREQIGFDCVTQQINYQNPERPGRALSIFDEMTGDVKKYGMQGVEMTPNVREKALNPRVWSWQQVHLANLEAALRLDWKRFAAITYFDGNSFIPIVSDPKARIFYDRLYKWVKGTLTPQDLDELCGAVVADLQSRGVLNEEAVRKIAEADSILKKLALMERPEAQRDAMLAAEKAPGEGKVIGDEWLVVTADDPSSGDVRKHLPGVCFLDNGEWAASAVQDGKAARLGGQYPGAGGPNFLVNNPPQRGIEVRLTYWTHSGGALTLYCGKKNYKVADLTATGRWATVTGHVPKDVIVNLESDRPEPGFNLLFDVHCKDVYVNKFEVRALPQ